MNPGENSLRLVTIRWQENVVIKFATKAQEQKDRFLLCYILQKGPGKEVITDVPSTENQVSSRSSQLSYLGLDLAILHNLGDALNFADHTQKFSRVCPLHHLTHSNQL